MKSYRIITILIAVLLLVGLLVPTVNAAPSSQLPAFAPARSSSPEVEVNRVEGDGLAFTVSMKVADLELTLVEEAGRQYTRVSLAGWAGTVAAGLPVLPVQVEQLGAPLGAEVSVEVSGGEAQRVKLDAPVLPGVTRVADWGAPVEDESGLMLPEMVEVYEEDAGVYGGGGVYPGELALVSGDGMLRQQRVVGVSVYPVQYDVAAGELVVYETVEVTVRFSGGDRLVAGGSVEESAVYEDLLGGQLLNYEAARDYRTAGVVESLPVENALEGMLGVDAAADGMGDWVPPDPGWRVKVREAGMYKLSYEELQAAGVPVVGLDVSTLQLFNGGMEVALDVELGGDGVWGAGDYVVFYGEALESKYTLDNVYWLTYGKATGLRMSDIDGTPGSGVLSEKYPESLHFENGTYYLSKVSGLGEKEHFFWGLTYATSIMTWSTNVQLAVPLTEPVSMRLSMFGGNTINHPIQVAVNGVNIGTINFSGITLYTTDILVPAGTFTDSFGDNSISFTSQSTATDLVYYDWIELKFNSTYAAHENELRFKFNESGTWLFQVSGFTSDQVAAFDISNPRAPASITGLVLSGEGPYTAQFQADVPSLAQYWTGTPDALKTVFSIEQDTPSDLHAPANAADYIVITHADFTAAAAALRDYRAGQGLRAVSVDVQDLYDEFGYGIIDPAAIHDFLAYAYTYWENPAPSYVLLLGDGNYDPKNYLKFNGTSYIPPYLLDVDPWIYETAADNRYVTLSGTDLLPDMMLGRFSVEKVADAEAMVQKVIAYEQNPPDGAWRNKILMVADNADGGGDFFDLSEKVVSCCVPSPYSVEKIYYKVTHTDDTATKNAIKAGYGSLILNYIGHGSYSSWAGEPGTVLFRTADIPLLTNGAQQPIVLGMTCLEGNYFQPKPSSSAVAEVATRTADRGAIASWSPTGQGVASGHDYLNRGFLQALLTTGVKSVGEATLAGKLNLWTAGASPDLMDTFILFGDPALRTRVSTTHITSEIPDPSAPGEPYTVSVEVKGSFDKPAGSVAVTDDEGNTCTADLVNGVGSCELTSFTPGNTVLTASFAGDSFYNASTGTANHLVSGLLYISGTILDSLSTPLAGVAVTNGQGKTVWTDALGEYTFSGLIAGNYTITPLRLGYTFEPESRQAKITNDNVTGVDFTATAASPIYTISGTIKNDQGDPLPGVLVSDDHGQTVLTDASGVYTLTNPAGSYTITPQDDVYVFNPESAAVDLIDADVTAIDFTGTVYIYPVGKPPLVSPAHKTKTNVNDITLVWKTVQDGAYYKLIVAKDEAFTQKVVKQTVYASGKERSLSYTLNDFPDGKYFWRVRAFNTGGVKLGTWSDVWMFKVDTIPPSKPVLNKPANDKLLADTTPTLLVLAATGAKYYQYQLATDSDFSTIVAQSDEKAGLEWTVPDAQPYGEYFWRARSFDAATNGSTWSAARRLLITFQKLPKYGAVTSVKRPTFEWVAVTGADNYRLIIDDDGVEPFIYNIDGLIPVTLHTLPVANKLAVGTYYWKMEARVGADWLATPWIPLTITP